ncbi:uncharacterized protein LOC114529891 isoform X2 [Dendronephthya gigantea]|uniref:uncharacterized protein LOC114529891 isoform X2 n=1 Tax=Dendronephthya gigantea TaxID=151771 RepID=UPI00106A5873|nr:uncharacterized protein LOC114529891 isoform X2 [Dendronephthya gigantea]
MALTWSDAEVPLTLFLERFNLPQIVQISEGAYGATDETTLGRGQELNLHALKDTQYYLGITDIGEEIYIPLNSPHKVQVFVEKCLDDCNTPMRACSVFPSKYAYVRLPNGNGTKGDEEGEKLKALYFDKDKMKLICLDSRGCEVTLGLDQLSELIVTEKHKDTVFIAEAHDKFSLPFTVQFIKQSSSSGYLPRGLIRVRKIVLKQTVIATSRDVESQSILTFPSTLDVTVFAPLEATGSHSQYRSLCEDINSKMNLTKVKENIAKNEGIYDDVEAAVTAIPYAESFFGKQPAVEASPTEEEDEDYPLDDGGYIDMESLFQKKDENDEGYEKPAEGTCKLESPVGGKKSSTVPRNPKTPFNAKFSTLPVTSRSPGLPKKDAADSTSPITSPKGLSYSTTPPADTEKRQEEDDYSDDSDGEVYEAPPVPVPPISPIDYNDRFKQTRQRIIQSSRKTEDLTVHEVKTLLDDLNLGQYSEVFEKEQVDGKILKELDKEILQSHFKMTPFHAHKLIKAISENWRPTITD